MSACAHVYYVCFVRARMHCSVYIMYSSSVMAMYVSGMYTVEGIHVTIVHILCSFVACMCSVCSAQMCACFTKIL